MTKNKENKTVVLQKKLMENALNLAKQDLEGEKEKTKKTYSRGQIREAAKTIHYPSKFFQKNKSKYERTAMVRSALEILQRADDEAYAKKVIKEYKAKKEERDKKIDQHEMCSSPVMNQKSDILITQEYLFQNYIFDTDKNMLDIFMKLNHTKGVYFIEMKVLHSTEILVGFLLPLKASENILCKDSEEGKWKDFFESHLLEFLSFGGIEALKEIFENKDLYKKYIQIVFKRRGSLLYRFSHRAVLYSRMSNKYFYNVKNLKIENMISHHKEVFKYITFMKENASFVPTTIKQEHKKENVKPVRITKKKEKRIKIEHELSPKWQKLLDRLTAA